MDKTGRDAVYEFDRFRLDVEKLMLYRDDIEVSMPPKMVKTLAVLVENRGEIIAKDDLLEQVWSDTIVDESNLSQHLYHLRKVLGALPDGRPYIETLRRRGYRFNGDAREAAGPRVDRSSIAGPLSVARAAGVERDGNVLRVVDWRSEPSNQSTVEPQIESSVSSRSFSRLWRNPGIVIGAILIIGFIGVATFFKIRSNAISSVAANTEISILRLTNGVVTRSAAISPSGDYFSYHEVTEEGEQLWLQQIGNASRVKIADAPKGMVYGAKTFSPDGKFLYFSLIEAATGKGTLYRIPAIGGPHAKMLDDVVLPISFAPDGTRFVFQRDDAATGSTSLVIADAESGSQRTIIQRTGQSRLSGSPAWSPDGKVIVFGSTDPGTSVGLYVTDETGSAPERVSAERWDNVYRIAWAADGRAFAMIATRSGDGYTTRRNQVYFVSFPGGTSRRLTTDGNRYDEWSLGVSNDEGILAVPLDRSSQIWSLASGGASSSAIQISRGIADGRAGLAPLPDGRIGFISRIGENLGVWIMNSDGSGLRQLPTGVLSVVEELRADPRGRFFIFSGYKDGISRLYRFDLERENLVQLTFTNDQPVDSTISADGTTAVYQSDYSNGVAIPLRLFKMSTDGGKAQWFGDVRCGTPHYSPAGDLLSCVRDNDLVILSAEGTQLRTLPLLPYARVNSGARWSPDGKGLVYIRTEKGVGNLWVQPLDGGSAKQLTDFTNGDIYNYAYSSDGLRLFVARGQQMSGAILLRNFR